MRGSVEKKQHIMSTITLNLYTAHRRINTRKLFLKTVLTILFNKFFANIKNFFKLIFFFQIDSKLIYTKKNCKYSILLRDLEKL